jgi:hypothetical protein
MLTKMRMLKSLWLTYGLAGAVAASVLGVHVEGGGVLGVGPGSVERVDNVEALGCTTTKFSTLHCRRCDESCVTEHGQNK